MEDYKQLAAVRPGNEHHDANMRRYIADWKKFWAEYVPEMIATRRVPDGAPWGKYPTVASAVTTNASQTWNVLVESFTPGAFKGVLFLGNPDMVAEDGGAHFGEQMTALANCMKKRFGGDDTPFYHTIPAKSLAANITSPAGIKGTHRSIELSDWADFGSVLKSLESAAK
jgi:hypothetical protein